jgi:peptidoglycan/LPS O-acetylase OafA/YrhL
MSVQRVSYSLLDGLRGIAAISVVFYHSCEYLFELPFAKSAHLAVDFFFLLSGFVVAHAYDGWRNGASALVLVRVIRLYPLYFVGFLLGAVYGVVAFTMHKGAMSQTGVMCALGFNAFMLPTPCESSGGMFPFNPPAWSLFYEMVMSLMFALGFMRSSKVTVVICILSAFVLFDGIREFNGMGFGWQKDLMYLGLAKVSFSFGLGLLIRRHLPIGGGFVPIALPVVVVLASFWLPLADNFKLIFEVVFAFALSPLVVWLAANAKPPESAVLQKILKGLGSMSYAMYITHLPLMFFFGFFGRKLSFPPFVVGGVYVILVALISLALHQYFDQPVRSWLSKRYLERSFR